MRRWDCGERKKFAIKCAGRSRAGVFLTSFEAHSAFLLYRKATIVLLEFQLFLENVAQVWKVLLNELMWNSRHFEFKLNLKLFRETNGPKLIARKKSAFF